MLISGSNSWATMSANAASRVDGATSTFAPAFSGVSDGSARQELYDYAAKSPAEKMRAAILGKLGVTEEEVAAMDPKEREKLEAKIKQMIKDEVTQQAEEKKGVLVDFKA
ncbi:hypothetical protein [Caulobacter endophyticus]|uniref:Uncharacterized protein n=1 Tax=Caulobacter endophyticus TaxID=2172652 RepID=A0A2T9KAQ4_9CAUL|nr:hypothetical protein [Caulobacter endophyticus]PVM93016.1 hypothetical protein DDF67_04850 [Caulobacter endophyticus]